MNPLQQIIAVVDPGMKSAAALRRATELARRSGARLHLFMGAYEPMIDTSRDLANGKVRELARTEYLEIRRHWLDREAALLAEGGLQVDYEVIWTAELHATGHAIRPGADHRAGVNKRATLSTFRDRGAVRPRRWVRSDGLHAVAD